MTTYSHSKVSTYENCPFQYKLHYIDKVKVGSKVKISNGYVKEFQGEPQLTAGKFGKLEVEGGEGGEENKEESEEVQEEKVE